MFRDRFWVCLLLTVPILALSEDVRGWLGLPPVRLWASGWVEPLLATAVYGYGAVPFLGGAVREVRGRVPGMMTLVALATTVAYAYSVATSLGVPGRPFYWELATLVVVMLFGHWMEMLAVQGASRALEHLASLLPSAAHRVRAEGTWIRRGGGLCERRRSAPGPRPPHGRADDRAPDRAPGPGSPGRP